MISANNFNAAYVVIRNFFFPFLLQLTYYFRIYLNGKWKKNSKITIQRKKKTKKQRERYSNYLSFPRIGKKIKKKSRDS